MSYYNKSNAAYDFANFAPAQEPQPEKPLKKQKRPAQKHQKAKKTSVRPATVVKWVFVSLFVMMSLTSIMVGNIKITELNDQVTGMQKKLDNSQSEQVSLNSKLESRMSMSKVEDYAFNKLGLVKIQPYQIQYVHLTDSDKVQVENGNSGIGGFFMNVFDAILEYFE